MARAQNLKPPAKLASTPTAQDEGPVENILAARVTMKKKRKTWMFLVKWKGQGSDKNSWEPVESITGAESLLEKFWRRVDGDGDGQAKKASAYKLGEELSDPTSAVDEDIVQDPTDHDNKKTPLNNKKRTLAVQEDEPLAKRGRQDDTEKTVPVSKKKTAHPAILKFKGSFDIYSMEIEELFEAYGIPEGNDDTELVPDYAGLYEAIQRKKVSPTARILFRDQESDLHEESDEFEDEDEDENPLTNKELYPMGRLEGKGVNDSVSEVPFNIAITEFQSHTKLSFSEDESMFFAERKDAEGPGVVAKLALADDGRHNGIVSSFDGEIKLIRAWIGKKNMELFEGMLSLDIQLERHGEEATRMAVWAVRSAEKSSDELEEEADQHWDLWHARYPGETVAGTIF